MKYKNGEVGRRGDDMDGIWVKYDQGSDYRSFLKLLQKNERMYYKRLEESAKIQLSNEGFYVYYEKDKEGEYKEPKIAIRIDVMKLIIEIVNKVNNNIELTKEELRFIYDLDSDEELFVRCDWYGTVRGLKEEIKNQRNFKKDLAFIFDCKEENIGTKLSDFESNDIICFYGNLEYDESDIPNNFRNLRYIVGDAYFNWLIWAKGLEKLQIISGSVYCRILSRAEGFDSLQIIGGNAIFPYLRSAEGFKSLKRIGNFADFDRLPNAKGFDSLQIIGGYAIFPELTSAEGFDSLQIIGGDAQFPYLTSAECFPNLQIIGGDANFRHLLNAKGFPNLQIIGGDADFVRLESSECFPNLQIIGRGAYFHELTSAKGFDSLETVNGEDATKFKEEINNRGSKTL